LIINVIDTIATKLRMVKSSLRNPLELGHPGQTASMFLDTQQGWIRHLTSLEHSKCQSESCPKIGDILVIHGNAPWKWSRPSAS